MTMNYSRQSSDRPAGCCVAAKAVAQALVIGTLLNGLLAAGPARAAQASTAGAQHAVPDTIAQRLAACTSCHGKEGRAASDGYYPRIAGKPEGYLFNQLQNFRDGKRTYPLMTYMVGQIPDAYLREMAAFFASQHPPYPAPQPTGAAQSVLERGGQLVQVGDRSKKLPACVACHGGKLTGIAPFIPGLLGLPRDYIVGQLGKWRSGVRHAHPPDCMAQIAKTLSPQDIGAVSSWLASRPLPEDVIAPLADADSYAKRPLACGSAPQ